MSSWKHLALMGVCGGGVFALIVIAVFLLWSGHAVYSKERVEQGLVVTSCGVGVSPKSSEPEAFVVTFEVHNSTGRDITVSKQTRIMGTAADTGSSYVVTEAELADTYVIPARKPAQLQMYLHMKCADESDWKKCFQSVYGKIESFEIVDTVVNLPKPRPTD